jgi:hypothetical protein
MSRESRRLLAGPWVCLLAFNVEKLSQYLVNAERAAWVPNPATAIVPTVRW